MNKPVRLIVGLGNPTSQYDGTYHNVGFASVDALLAELGGTCEKRECKALTCHALVDGHKVIVAKPQTYMNLSGDAVQELVHKYKIALADVLVVYDDVDIPLGTLRLRTKGSGGTHNGMRDVCLKIGEDFNRLRVGIGKPPPPMQLVDYVLAKVRGDNLTRINAAIERAVPALVDFAAGDDPVRIGSTVNG